jgi:hypothetical protein
MRRVSLSLGQVVAVVQTIMLAQMRRAVQALLSATSRRTALVTLTTMWAILLAVVFAHVVHTLPPGKPLRCLVTYCAPQGARVSG